jgi:amino acid adenylation domain-containing protein
MSGQSPTVHLRFAKIAASLKDTVALSTQAQTMTFGELETRSSRLARYLLGTGARPGAPIAVAGSRSIEMIVAWLAVLKAGCAYLPIDPDTPPASCQTMIEESRPAVILHDRGFAFWTSAAQGIPTLELLDAIAACHAEDPTPPPVFASSESPAYVMFTSGSMGRPKGVVVPHRGILRLVVDASFAELSPQTVFLQLAPIGFDASTLEVFGPLLNGGRLEIYDDAVVSVDRVSAAISRSGANSLWLTAGLFHLFAETQLDSLRGLKQLLVGGDVLSPAHVRAAIAALPGCTLINGYGPTENTTFTCCYSIPAGGWGDGSVPIGFPIRGSSVHILDNDLSPVPDGDVGTLWTGGDGVALGYLNQPELTAQRFRPDPFASADRKMYCTGDLARRRADGAIEFHGRKDREIKIDGKRVSADDIELVVRDDERVADAVVTVRDIGNGSKRTTAFVKANGEPSADLANMLKRDLADAHPVQLVPHEIVVVERFPLNLNGKVDRQALMLASAEGPAVSPSVSHHDPMTVLIADIFKSILDVGDVDVTRNFFDIGMTSLMLMRAHARIVAATGRSFDITLLFSCANIAALADKLQQPTAPDHRSDSLSRAAMQREAMQRLRRA